MFRVCLSSKGLVAKSLITSVASRPINIRYISNTPTTRFKLVKDRDVEGPQRDAALDKIKEQIEAIPELMQLTIEFKEMFIKKGYLEEGKPINISTLMYRVLTDRDVRSYLGKMKQLTEEHKLEINEQDYDDFIGAVLRNKKSLDKE